MSSSAAEGPAPPIDAVAAALVQARLDGAPLSGFPGPPPQTLDDAYAVQDAAIARWPDAIAGWKIGLVPPGQRPALTEARLAGPVFAGQVRPAQGETPVPFPVFVGGFAAVEAEFVFRIGADAPTGRTAWTAEQAAEAVDALFIGVETAGSPIHDINGLGAAIVAADFGNNAGLILGPEARDWRGLRPEDLQCETWMDGRPVGRGSAAVLPGGPFEALRFLLEHCARRGRPLKAGQLVSSGALTGIHEIEPGQTARVDFGRFGAIVCTAHPAKTGRG